MSALQTSLRNSSGAACALRLQQRARLSALTLAALATGFYPDGSASEPGFPQTAANGCFSRFAGKAAAVKHAPCGPVLVPVDRGSEAARVRIGNSARGDRASLHCYGMPSGTAPSLSGIDAFIVIAAWKSKRVAFPQMNQNDLACACLLPRAALR